MRIPTLQSMLACSAAACAVFAAAPSWAQSKTFNIPAQSAASGIPEFARQADIQILVSDAAVRGKATAAINGVMPIRAALQRLIAGTGLKVASSDGRTFTLASKESPRGNDAGEPDSLAADAEGSDIVVTAQKKAERLADIPQSITALSGATLQNLSATQFRDFADTVPGLSYQSAGVGQNQITIRGVTTGADISPTVGIYVDDVAFGSTTNNARGASLALDLGLFDVDRIEVLRGPQGTLYGASTMGGLIKYVATKPNTQRFSLDTQAGLSSTRYGGISYNAAAAANVPISEDKAAVRVTGYYSRDGGYIDNIARNEKDVNASRVYGARGDILLTPTEDLTIRLGGYFQDIQRSGNATADFDPQGRPINGTLIQSRPFSEPFDQRFWLISGTIQYNLGFASLSSISSYQSADTQYRVDYSPDLVPLLSQIGAGDYSGVANRNAVRTLKFTQEVRLASNENDRFEWIAGAYYNRERSSNHQQFETLDVTGAPVANTIFTFDLPSKFEEIAGFGNATLHLVRRQNIWRISRCRLAECGPRLGVDVKRRACGVASADVRWSVA